MMLRIEMGLLIVIVKMDFSKKIKNVSPVNSHVLDVVLKLNVLKKENMVQFMNISESVI